MNFTEADQHLSNILKLAFSSKKDVTDDGTNVKARVTNASCSEVDDTNNFLLFLIDKDVARVEITMNNYLWHLPEGGLYNCFVLIPKSMKLFAASFTTHAYWNHKCATNFPLIVSQH